MDKNLNSNPKPPWWLVMIQISPILLQLVTEIVARYMDTTLISNVALPERVIIPDPVQVETSGDDQSH